MAIEITHLVPFAAAISLAVCKQANTRINNLAMLRALNAQSMPNIVNLKKQAEASIAYLNVLEVLTAVRLQIVGEDEQEDLDNLKLTYDRFRVALAAVKHHLLIINS